MKRVIASFDPETNPADAARACVETLNSDITKLHNLVLKWNKLIKVHPDDDTVMNKIVDDTSYMQHTIDTMLDHYYKTMYDSSISTEG